MTTKLTWVEIRDDGFHVGYQDVNEWYQIRNDGGKWSILEYQADDHAWYDFYDEYNEGNPDEWDSLEEAKAAVQKVFDGPPTPPPYCQLDERAGRTGDRPVYARFFSRDLHENGDFHQFLYTEELIGRAKRIDGQWHAFPSWETDQNFIATNTGKQTAQQLFSAYMKIRKSIVKTELLEIAERLSRHRAS